MPAKAQPKFYQLLLKTHKLTIVLTVPQTATVASLKHEAFAALASDVNQVEDVPKVTSEDEFEICSVKRDKGKRTAAKEYQALDGSLLVKSSLANWEHLFLQFRNEDGELMPIEYTQPALTYDDDEPNSIPVSTLESPSSKGKRKAPSD